VRVDGGQRHRADALEIAGGGPVPPLDAEVEDGEREEEEADEGEGVDGDDDRTDHAEESGKEYVQDEGQAVVHCVQITGKSEEKKIQFYRIIAAPQGTVFVCSTDNGRGSGKRSTRKEIKKNFIWRKTGSFCYGTRYCPYTIPCTDIIISRIRFWVYRNLRHCECFMANVLS
jgi:hypothetical protein